MKKGLKTFLAILLVSCIAGCTNKDDTGIEPVNNKAKVCVSINREEIDAETVYEIELKAAFKALSETFPNELSFYNVSKNQGDQNNSINKMLSEGCSAIILELVDTSFAQAITEKIQATELPLIYIENEPSEDVLNAYAGKSTYIGADQQRNDVAQGEIIAALPNYGNINGDDVVSAVVLSVNEISEDVQTALVSAINAKGVQTEILEAATSENTREKGQEAAARLLTRYGDKIDVFFAESEALALGASDAIEAAGRDNGVNIYLVSGEDGQLVRYLINDEKITGSIWDDVEARAKAAAESTVKVLKGETLGLRTLISNKKAMKDQ